MSWTVAAGCGTDSAAPVEPPEVGWASRVDPFIGTGGHGHVYPGATVPFGTVQLTPDNGRSGWDWTSGYHWSDSVMVGFVHTALSGTGIGDLRDVLVMPVAGPVELAYAAADGDPPEARPYGARFSHDDEEAEPGYYAVTLQPAGEGWDGPIRAELTATRRAGLHRYTFPASADAGLVLDLGHAANWDEPVETALRLYGDTLLTGHRFSTGWARDQRVFFAARLSKPIVHVSLADGERRLGAAAPDGELEVRGERLRALLHFETEAGEMVELAVGLSYVDVEGALANLEAELGSAGAPSPVAVSSPNGAASAGRVAAWDFDDARRAARAAWEEALGGVRVRPGAGWSPEEARSLERTFYTALYRTKLAPVRFADIDERYRGADGEVRRQEGFEKYAIFSLWDTFRAAHPLFTLLEPHRVDDMVGSMLSFARESGHLPVWSLVGSETNTMTGYHAVPVIADAWLKGHRGWDGAEALGHMVRTATRDGWRGIGPYRELGYVPSDVEVESVTKTLEYAFDDWAVARMAEALGEEEVRETFDRRARSWRFVFDPVTRFMRGRRADGRWVEPFDPRRSSHREGTDYTEGNAWQHSWFVPHEVPALVHTMGGEAAFVARLDSLFEMDSEITGEDVSPDISGLIGQYAHGNEPSHHIPWLYAWAGAPWRTQSRVREVLATQYADAPDGLAGNEDCGQMSAWYVFAALGLYPANPVGGVYVLGSPLFEAAEVEVPGGVLRIVAEGASAENRYVQSARWNGRPLERAWLGHDELVAGGELRLVLGPEPDRAWGAAPAARPPTVAPGLREGSAGPEDEWAELADRAVEAFRHAWRGYLAHARGHDALRPLSRSGRDWHDASLVMTPVDAFDTMLLMGLEEEVEEAKGLIFEGLSFDHDISVQVFEITIRLLGGLLSAHQMDGDPRFLELARELGERLLPAFDSPTGMPYVNVNLRTGEPSGRVNNPAEIGTLVLELGTLSRLTGDPRYYEAAKRGMRALYDRRSAIGLVGTTIDVETGAWRERTSHVGGRIDSWYEYLLKAWLLFGDEDFRRMWEASRGPLHEHLAEERETPEGPRLLWYGHADMETGERTSTRFGALEAFLPGVLVLDGDVERAARLMESVHAMWTRFGVEPEQLDYATMEVVSPGYVLRPEALESAFYLWRATGDERYRAMGRTMFEAIVRCCRVPAGYAALADVRTLERRDDMESFFLAETLKYAWLLFAPPDALELRTGPGEDESGVVFNTEAHPLWRTWE